jgi:hypothetical protein
MRAFSNSSELETVSQSESNGFAQTPLCAKGDRMHDIIAQGGLTSVMPSWPVVEAGQVPAKLSKRLWVEPSEFVCTTQALELAEWTLCVCPWGRPPLPTPSRWGGKAVYGDRSILVMAFIQVAWQFGYEEVIDYLRTHAAVAMAVGLPAGRIICASQYWRGDVPWVSCPSGSSLWLWSGNWSAWA